MRSNKLFSAMGARHASVTPLFLLAVVLFAALSCVSALAQTIYESNDELGDWTVSSGALAIDTTALTMTSGAVVNNGIDIDGVAVFRRPLAHGDFAIHGVEAMEEAVADHHHALGYGTSATSSPNAPASSFAPWSVR